MKNEFVPYEEALTMKELGFDEKCFGFYNPTITKDVIINNDSYGGFGLTQDQIVVAPTFSQAFRWFREKGYETVKKPFYDSLEDLTTYVCDAIRLSDGRVFKTERKNTYEEAELACLRKLIEIVNQNKDE